MNRLVVALFSILPVVASADLLSCEQKQALCETQCQVTSIGDKDALKTCQARCLGEQASCLIDAGVVSAKELADKAVEAGKIASEEVKAFLEGFNKK